MSRTPWDDSLSAHEETLAVGVHEGHLLRPLGRAAGLEAPVGAVGPASVVAMIVLVPLLWGMPIAVMVAELTGALPDRLMEPSCPPSA